MRLAVLTSHPIQYQAPLFRALAKQVELVVFFGHSATPSDQANAGFGVSFEWDVDLLEGHEHRFLTNVAKRPGLDHFAGCDTPEFAQWLDNDHFDAVLVMGWHFKSYIQAFISAKRRRIPVLVRGDSQLETRRRRLKRAVKAFTYPAFLRAFDAALYVGQRSRSYWIHYRYPEERLFFSPHSIETEWFAARADSAARAAKRARLGIAQHSPVILFAGKLVPFKRPYDLIAAAAKLKETGQEIDLMFAGAGALHTELLSAAGRAGVNCHMLGFCNQTEMPAVYAAADVLVLPSTARETWGLVANEALACGRPIVLSDAVGAAPDLAADGAVGRVFPVGDTAALADAIGDILQNPPPPSAINARISRYSISASVEGIVQAAERASQKPRHTVRDGRRNG
jgi:glycosyltransferase involved in cell wall biosynthesis